MRWPFVVEVSKQRIEGDSIIAALGAKVRKKRAGLLPTFPGIFWIVTYDTVRENDENIIITWEIWGYGADETAQIEGRLRALLHADKIQVINGVSFWNMFEDGRDIDADIEMGITARSLDFRYVVERTGHGKA